MAVWTKNKKDALGGLIIAAFGVVGLAEGLRLGSGTLRNMGPGYVPTALGFILIGLGLFMILGPAQSEDDGQPIIGKPDWRGWLCIIAGMAAFMVLGEYTGLVPAAFACVFISCWGDREATLLGTTALSVGITAMGVVLFYYILGVSIPLFMR